MTTGAKSKHCPIKIRILHVLLAINMETASVHCEEGLISPLLKSSK